MDFSHKLLLATPNVDSDSVFSESLVYVTSHNRESTQGFIINKRSKTTMNNLTHSVGIDQQDLEPSRKGQPLNVGGSVNSMRIFIMYRGVLAKPELSQLEMPKRRYIAHDGGGDKSKAIKVTQDLTLSESLMKEILLHADPGFESLVLLGQAAWEPDQLYQEVKYDQWLVLDGNPDIIFSADIEKRRELAAQAIDLDLNRWIPALQQA